MASISIPCPKIPVVGRAGSTLQRQQQQQKQEISFRNASGPNPSLSFGSPGFSGFQCPSRSQALWKAHAKLNEVVAEKPSNSSPIVDTKSKVASSEGKVESAEKVIPDVAAIRTFMSQVTDLVKLVDSRDIVELQMKQSDCELTIKKKEALPQSAPVVTMPPPMPHVMYATPPPAALPPPPTSAPASPASSAPARALPSPAKPAQSSHPPLKCPMAGTFYRSPAPGEPPFVNVGDKVQKGQVVCIIEAMKLMNEIEADQSGTVTKILMEDGKPVSVDTPLFVIVP